MSKGHPAIPARRPVRLLVPMTAVAMMLGISIFMSSGKALSGQGQRPEFRWPIEKGEFPELEKITSTFGESRIDHFHNGLDIAGLNDPIYPVADGEVLFSRTVDDDPYMPVQGPGNFIFLHHDGGWWSGYYHLREIDEGLRSGPVDGNTVIGFSHNSGHSGGPHLHFFVGEEYGHKIINPLLVLPKATDENPPDIRSLLIVTGDERFTRLSADETERIRLTQPYPILIEIIDPGFETYTRRGVYILEWELNGQGKKNRQFDYIEFRDWDWKLSGHYSFGECFLHDHYNLGTLDWVNGLNVITIKAIDYAGNISEATFRVSVDREY